MGNFNQNIVYLRIIFSILAFTLMFTHTTSLILGSYSIGEVRNRYNAIQFLMIKFMRNIAPTQWLV
ncbi:MAG: hypothetical protein LIO85_02655, partial [Rikenellaceae bacterium]|nr:hypothetical protein [Rikenellaceae bacterium]